MYLTASGESLRGKPAHAERRAGSPAALEAASNDARSAAGTEHTSGRRVDMMGIEPGYSGSEWSSDRCASATRMPTEDKGDDAPSRDASVEARSHGARRRGQWSRADGAASITSTSVRNRLGGVRRRNTRRSAAREEGPRAARRRGGAASQGRDMVVCECDGLPARDDRSAGSASQLPAASQARQEAGARGTVLLLANTPPLAVTGSSPLKANGTGRSGGATEATARRGCASEASLIDKKFPSKKSDRRPFGFPCRACNAPSDRIVRASPASLRCVDLLRRRRTACLCCSTRVTSYEAACLVAVQRSGALFRAATRCRRQRLLEYLVRRRTLAALVALTKRSHASPTGLCGLALCVVM